MEVPKIEQLTFEQLQVVDVLAVGEVKLVPQDRVQQRVDCMEVVPCEQEQERTSERTVEQSDVLFVARVRQTMELADIPVAACLLQSQGSTAFSGEEHRLSAASASWGCKAANVGEVCRDCVTR